MSKGPPNFSAAGTFSPFVRLEAVLSVDLTSNLSYRTVKRGWGWSSCNVWTLMDRIKGPIIPRTEKWASILGENSFKCIFTLDGNLTHQRETSCNIESWLVQTVILKSFIEVTSTRTFPSAFYSAKSTPRQVRSATLSGGERRVSLPNGHYSASTMGRASSDAPRFRHYGSSLSLAEGHGTHELTSRTLRHYCYFDLWSYFFSEMGNAIIYLFQCNDR